MAAYPPLVSPPFVAPPPGSANPQQKVQNARRDQRRKDGAAVLRAVKTVGGDQTATVPPPNSTADPVPQHAPLPAAPQMGTPTSPVPAYTPPVYHQPEYQPPKKGLEYLALGLGVLFPGSPISKMAAGFAGGLQEGAQQSYERKKDAAQADYQNQANAAQADFQNRLAAYNAEKDQIATKFANDQEGFNVAVKGLDVKYGDDVARYNANQQLRARGIDPATQKPFVLPKALATPPPPTAGYDGLARWHEQRAAFYEQIGASDVAAQEKSAGADATKEAIDAANNARALAVALQASRERWKIHADTEARADARHFDSEYRSDRRALLADSTKRTEYRVRAMDADRAFLTDYRKLTTGPTKIVKDPQTGAERQVPVTDANGNPVPATITGQQQKLLVDAINRIRSKAESDPEGAADHFSRAFDDSPNGLAAKQLLDEAAKGAIFQRMADGTGVSAHGWPTYEVPKQKPFSGKVSPEVAQLVAQSRKNGATDDKIRAAMKQDGHSDAEISAALAPPPAAAPNYGSASAAVRGPMPSGATTTVRMP